MRHQRKLRRGKTPRKKLKDWSRASLRDLQLRVPRRYQDEAIDFLCDNQFVALFIDMGLGKTMILLHAFLEFPKPILLVGPIRVIEVVWRAEAKEWRATRNLTFTLLRGTPAERAKKVWEDTDVHMVNPELLEEILSYRDDYEVLVIDESTIYKNPSAKRFKLLRKHLKKFSRRIIATGGPVPQSLMNIWSQIFIVDRGERLDTSFERFKRKFFYPTDYMGYKWEPHDWAQEAIIEELGDVVYRTSIEDAKLELHEPIDAIVSVHLPAKARRHYDEMEKEAFTKILNDTELTAETAAIKSMKLRQITAGFAYDEDSNPHKIHSAKLDALEDVIEGLQGKPLITIYHFKFELRMILERFPNSVVFGRTGRYGEKKKDGLAEEHRDAWNRGEIEHLLLNPQSGGHGLNLQFGGHHMAIYSGSFSQEHMDQVRHRIDRSGQTEICVYHWLTVPDSVDELVYELFHSRTGNQADTLQKIRDFAKKRLKK